MPKTTEPGGRNILLLLCVSIPSFMINLDSNIVAVSLPSIGRSLGADFAGLEWVISAYTLTFASLVMPAGALADRYGRKRMLILGLLIFTLASLLCGAAPGIAVLNGARALQGVGAALQLSAGLAILSHGFRGIERAKAFAFWGSAIGVAIALGPIAGGVITQSFGWAWAFYVNVPVGAVMIVVSLVVVGESRDPEAKRIDLAGFLSFSAALFLTILALISGNREGWADPLIRGAFGGALILFLVFLAVERLQARPMLDLGFFRRPTYIGANIASLAFAGCLLTMLTFLPVYFQNGLAVRPRTAGLMMLPMALPLFIVPRLVASHLTHRLSGRALLTLGLGLVGLGLLWLAFAAPRYHYPLMLGGMLVAGIGAGILNGEVAKVGMTVIPPERAGMASGVGGTVRFAGIVIGFAALGAVLFGRVLSAVSAALPAQPLSERLGLVRAIVSGNLAGQGKFHDLALASFGAGYQAILAVAAILALAAALLSALLVRSAETAPLPRRDRSQTVYLPVVE
jgi:EmrB/QacA subfamily drug resistance transporter